MGFFDKLRRVVGGDEEGSGIFDKIRSLADGCIGEKVSVWRKKEEPC